MDAGDRDAAMARALASAYVVTWLAPLRSSFWAFLTKPRGRPRSAEVALFLRQLGHALAVGVAVPDALALQSETLRGSLQPVVAAMTEAVRAGTSVANAMAVQRFIPPVVIQMVRAGETTGDLSGALSQAGALLAADIVLRGKMRRAMLHPAIVLGLLVTGGAVLARFVFPRFVELFAGLGAELPPATHVMVILTQWVETHWTALLIGAGVGVVGFTTAMRTRVGARARDALLWRIPFFRGLLRAAVTARLCRTLSGLLQARANLADSAGLLAGAAGNRHAERKLAEGLAAVQGGAPLSVALAAAGILPPLAVYALRAGESAGTLDETAEQAAAYFEAEADARLQVLAEGLLPVVMVAVAFLVLGVALSVYLPLSSILSQVY